MIFKIVADREVNPLVLIDHGATIEARFGDDIELVLWANTTCKE